MSRNRMPGLGKSGTVRISALMSMSCVTCDRSQTSTASPRSADDALLLELRRCLIQGVLHRRPCRVRPGLHVLPRRFASRAYFLQFLVRGVAASAHCLELLVIFGPRVGTHLGAFGFQSIDLSIPFPDLRFHHREVFIFLAHGETPLLGSRHRADT